MKPCRPSKPFRGRRLWPALGAALLLTLAPVTAWAGEWKSGDVFVGLSTGAYNVYGNDGTLQETVIQAPPAGALNRAVDCAFDRSGQLFTTNFDNNRINVFLGPHPHALQPDLLVGPSPESITFARNGDFYVGHQVNPSSIRKLTGVGTPITTFTPALGAALLDLAADQRTMFYTARTFPTPPVIHRFDVAANANLPDYANIGGTARIADFKLLPPGDGSGGAIVAQTDTIKRVDGSGTVVREYDADGANSWFGIALDPDGQSFWAQTNSDGKVFRFNIASGVADRGPLPSAATAFGICVKGTRTAAIDNASPSIRIGTPANGASFTQGQAVAADYSCSDDANGTGIKSCAGPVAPGANLDTGSVGTKTFTVDASDNAGNTAGLSHTYTVVPPTPPPPPPAPPPRLLVSLAFEFRVTTTSTTLTRLSVKDIPRGSTLRAKCRPKPKKSRCRVKSFTKRRARGTVTLKRFMNKPFKPGAVIDVRVTKPGFIGAVKLLTIRNRKAPSTATKCLPIGKTKPRKC